MKDDKTLLELLRKIIFNETLFLRHYYARVVSNDDPEGLGRVKVDCFDLAMTGGAGLWVASRDKHSMSVPVVNDWVEIYFMMGDRTKPVYIGIVTDFENMQLNNFDGNATTHVLFEDPDNNCNIKYDSTQNLLTFFEGLKSFVLGEDLITAFNSHTHPYVNVSTPSSTSAPTVPLTDSILSKKIKGA